MYVSANGRFQRIILIGLIRSKSDKIETDKLNGLYITVAKLHVINTIVNGIDETAGKIGRSNSPSKVIDTSGGNRVMRSRENTIRS